MPLHIAAGNKASAEVLVKLLDAHPEAALVADSRGQLPLHCAATNQSSVEVVEVLVAEHPGAAKVLDGFGCLPLDCATEYMASTEVALALITADPESTFDDRYRTIIQTAVRHSLHVEMVRGRTVRERARCVLAQLLRCTVRS